MKLLWQYLKSKAVPILLFAFFAGIMAFSFSLYHLPVKAVMYPAVLCALLGLAVLVVGFLRTLRMHKLISGLREMDADLPEVRNVEAADYRDIVRLLQEQNREVSTHAEMEMNAMMDYYTLWAHQIKTPIAAMRLRLQDEDTPQARTLLADLGRIERYVSMVLTYLRLEGSSTDYVIRETDLDSILRPVFKQFAGEFISRKLKLDYTPVNKRVLTDEKWLSFVVEQLLSNALKYTPAGSVSVYLEEPVTLCIRDTGIGIAPEDLPRVFERSYTGLTGRADKRASGLGLSLCRQVCDRLGHGLSIESVPDHGTVVRVDLSAGKLSVE